MLTVTIMVHVFECRRPTLPTVSVTVDKDGLVNTVNLVSYGACYHRFCNMRGATTGAGIAYPSGAPEFTPGFSGVRVTRSLVLCVCFVDRCLSFCTFSFCYCVVFSSWIYRTLITWLVSSNSSYPITSSVTVTKIENFSIVILYSHIECLKISCYQNISVKGSDHLAICGGRGRVGSGGGAIDFFGVHEKLIFFFQNCTQKKFSLKNAGLDYSFFACFKTICFLYKLRQYKLKKTKTKQTTPWPKIKGWSL